MGEVYTGRHRRPATDEPTPRLKWALTQRDQLGITHRRAAEPEDGEQ